MLKYAAAVSVAGLIGWGLTPTQADSCDPKAPPTEAQTARRHAAVNVARQINTAEAAIWRSAQRYAPLDGLAAVTVPEGFEAQVSTDGTTYTFSVKDKQDACGFAVFSDQNGLIYNASPLR